MSVTMTLYTPRPEVKYLGESYFDLGYHGYRKKITGNENCSEQELMEKFCSEPMLTENRYIFKVNGELVKLDSDEIHKSNDYEVFDLNVVKPCKHDRSRRYSEYYKRLMKYKTNSYYDPWTNQTINCFVCYEKGYRQGWMFNKKFFNLYTSSFYFFDKKSFTKFYNKYMRHNEDGKEAYEFFMNKEWNENTFLEVGW